MSSASPEPPRLAVDGLAYGYGTRVLQHDLTFAVAPGEVLCVIGGSGCGKSTLLRVLTGLLPPLAGTVGIDGQDFWAADASEREALIRRFGMMYQGGALWTSMTLAENVAMPLALYTGLDARGAAAVAAYKLALVGLAGFEDFLPAAISGGMAKRAAIARAMALDPSILFLDEPSAGLDPVTSHRLDDLILDLRRTLSMSFVIVTHELASIFRIADRVVYLDAATHTMTAIGPAQAAARREPGCGSRGIPQRRRERRCRRSGEVSVRGNATAVGAFVLGALAIAIGIAVVFGSGLLFRNVTRYVIFFRNSLEGLSVGAPVKFAGVQIGQVVSITPSFAPNERVVDIPVVVELTKGSVKGFDESNVTLDQLIQDGLRARLELASLITGQLYVGLNIIPRCAAPRGANPTGYTQIPSLTSLQYGVRETLTDSARRPAEDREGSGSDARAPEHHGRRRRGGADHADDGCGDAAAGEAVRSGGPLFKTLDGLPPLSPTSAVRRRPRRP